MSYYDDPTTFIHAQIASQTSILTDYTYTLNKVNSQIDTYQPDVPQELLDQQAQLQSNIDSQQQAISTLQSYLVVDLSSNLVDLSGSEVVPPLVDLSSNEIVPPLIPQAVPPLVDLSSNIIS
jgi:uncharacterized phage infection (PIP) family protein YhgE